MPTTVHIFGFIPAIFLGLPIWGSHENPFNHLGGGGLQKEDDSNHRLLIGALMFSQATKGFLHEGAGDLETLNLKP